ncbi:hypothetical protein ACCC84_21355 [Serratia odorifera]|uniref:hypothetical protein n=1 Tax=Serratia odorifera TaxID=618 RepID=UPI0035323F16
MIVTRPTSSKEPDLLCGYETAKLVVKDLSGANATEYATPEQGWTHASLEALDLCVAFPDGWDAFLGGEWVGSSEI